LSKKIEEINEILKKKPINAENIIENNKDFQKCLSYRSENIDNDMEENIGNASNEIKFMEKNMNNLRWKDSTKKCEGLLIRSNSNSNSKKNSQIYNEELFNLLEEVNKIKQRLENFEKAQEILSDNYKEINNNNNKNNILFESAAKFKKQEVFS